jgi:hypothetical protein
MSESIQSFESEELIMWTPTDSPATTTSSVQTSAQDE